MRLAKQMTEKEFQVLRKMGNIGEDVVQLMILDTCTLLTMMLLFTKNHRSPLTTLRLNSNFTTTRVVHRHDTWRIATELNRSSQCDLYYYNEDRFMKAKFI